MSSRAACPSCGHEGTEADRFCARCGAVLPTVSDHTGVLSSVEDATGEHPRSDDPTAGMTSGAVVLEVRRGPEAGALLRLDGPVGTTLTAGRGNEVTFYLDDVTVSRLHVRFHHSAGGWQVVDEGSLNGTYLNRERIDSAPLNSGDELQVGKYRFLVHVAGESA